MITVIGATGFTGTLISELLDREGLAMRLTGRDKAKLDGLAATLSRVQETRVLDVRDRHSLKEALNGSRVVINCAGPFSIYGEAVVESTVSSGIHYLDITGEQQFIKLVIDRFSKQAAENGCTAIPSCAFEYAMADTAAALLEVESGDVESIEINYIIDGMFTSRGTKRSVLCALEAPAYQLVNGELRKISGGNISTFKTTDGKTLQRFPFPGGEVYMLPLHMSVKNVSTYLTAETPPAVLSLLSSFAPLMVKAPLKGLLDAAINLTEARPQRRGETSFTISCVSAGKNGKRGMDVSGKDPYYLTAVIASQCAKFLMESEAPRGAISASMLSGGEFIKSITEKYGVRWNVL